MVQAPVGAAPAAQILDWLIAHGVKKSSAVVPAVYWFIRRKAFFWFQKSTAGRRHFLPLSSSLPLRGHRGSPKKGYRKGSALPSLPYEEVITWSTDGFFRETKEKVEYRKSEGCTVVEMECSALAAVAKMRDIQWGSLLYTGDSLANVEEHDMRSFGIGSREIALRLSIESVLEM